MQPATGGIQSIQRSIIGIVTACNSAADLQTDTEIDLPVFTQTLNDLVDVMHRGKGDAGGTGTEDITEIGEYAIRLVENLPATAENPGLPEQSAM